MVLCALKPTAAGFSQNHLPHFRFNILTNFLNILKHWILCAEVEREARSDFLQKRHIYVHLYMADLEISVK